MAKQSDKIGEAARQRAKKAKTEKATHFSAVDAGDLHRFLDGAVRNGALVSFASTKDGSAVVLTILHDEIEDGKYKDYFDEEGLYEEVHYWAGVFGE